MTILKSCCCFKLETGGKILAWINIISYIFSAFGSLPLWLKLLENFKCHHSSYSYGREDKGLKAIFGFDGCGFAKIILIFNSSSQIMICVERILASILLLIGINKRNPGFVIPLLLLDAVYLGMYALGLLLLITDGMQSFIALFIISAISVYFFIVEYSIYEKFRDEMKSNQQVQYQVQNNNPVQYIPNVVINQ